ncbi:unnamed protein product [Periconia digitata]|uniref:Uncharacterized protein n=1 Tax=Periconia digitata TaxID=1303443 RepID=A0A9W4U6F1_9PLEO|nr:unnamed protein product [Periconia digitata]
MCPRSHQRAAGDSHLSVPIEATRKSDRSSVTLQPGSRHPRASPGSSSSHDARTRSLLSCEFTTTTFLSYTSEYFLSLIYIQISLLLSAYPKIVYFSYFSLFVGRREDEGLCASTP